MARLTITVDDMTGKAVPTTEVAIVIAGAKASVDLSEDSVTALKALAAQDGSAPELFRALFGKTSSSSSEAGDSTRAKEWFRSLTVAQIDTYGLKGKELNDKGRAPNWLTDAYARHHGD